MYYVDVQFVCCDCDREQIWTAEQQKWYYEVAKGSLYSKAVRCLDCRRKRTELYSQGDPHPVKRLGTLMKRLLKEIGPTLAAVGFNRDSQIAPLAGDRGILEFSRPDEIVVINYQRPDGSPRLVAESFSEAGGYVLLSCVDLNPKTNVLDAIGAIRFAIEQRFNQL